MINLTTSEPLVFLRLKDERILLPWTVEKLKSKMQFDYLDTETGRLIPTAKNIILDSGIGTAWDFFEYYGKKTVEPFILSRLYSRTSSMDERERHKLTNVQIWGFIEKIRDEEKILTEKTERMNPDKFLELDRKIRKKLGIKRPFTGATPF